MPLPIKLVVGLGNPEEEFVGTRHNLGYEFIDKLDITTIKHVFGLQKPNVYINHCGVLVNAMCLLLDLKPQEVLVVLDCLALPLGEARYRPSGSFGGHNGLKSIIKELGTEDIPRLRLGVGPVPSDMNITDFVCGKFFDKERPLIDEMLNRSAKWLTDVALADENYTVKQLNAALQQKETDNV